LRQDPPRPTARRDPHVSSPSHRRRQAATVDRPQTGGVAANPRRTAMTVKVRPYKRGGWEVDIMLTFPGRRPIRERRKAPVGTKSAAKRWGEERERQLLQHYTSTDPDEDTSRPGVSKKEVPTLAEFVPRYMEGHCEANRLSPATIDHKNTCFKNHIVPIL